MHFSTCTYGPKTDNLPHGISSKENVAFVSLLVRNFTTEFRNNYSETFIKAESAGAVGA